MAAGLAGPQGEGVDACGVAMSSLGMNEDGSKISITGVNSPCVRVAHAVRSSPIVATNAASPCFDSVLVDDFFRRLLLGYFVR